MQLAHKLPRSIESVKGRNALIGVGAVALAGAATAAYVAWSAREAEAKYPPRGHFIDVDGMSLHYLDKGTGPAVVLLHGNRSMATDFEGAGLIDALSKDHRVLAFDRPGFGYSERPRDRQWTASEQARVLIAAMNHLGAGPAILAGHSRGAMVALEMARQAPHLVRHLILISGVFYSTKRAGTPLSGAPFVGDVMRYTSGAIASRMNLGKILKRVFGPQKISEGFIEAVPSELVLRPSQLRALAEESSMMTADAARLSPTYGEIVVPTTILAGSEDGMVSTEEQSARLHRELPHSRLHVIERAGHMLHYAAPQVLAENITGHPPRVPTPTASERGSSGIATPS